MATVFTFHAGKAVVQITAIEIAVDHLLDIRPPESVLPGEMLVIDLDKGLKIVLDAAVVIRVLQISWTINGGRSGHDLSPWRISCRHNVERAFYLSRRIGRLGGTERLAGRREKEPDGVKKEITDTVSAIRKVTVKS